MSTKNTQVALQGVKPGKPASEAVRLDKKDRQILDALEYNARLPLTQLARKVGLSPQTTDYRLKRLMETGVIHKFVTIFNNAKLGYEYYRLYIRYENVSPKDEKKIVDYFADHPNTVWVVSASGRFDLEAIFLAKSFIHFSAMLQDAYQAFPGKLHNNVPSVSITLYHHPSRHLADKKRPLPPLYGGEPEHRELDATDRKIAKYLSQHARASNTQIGQELGLNYKTVQARVKKLEDDGVVQAFRVWVDFAKTGHKFYKILVKLKKFTREEEKTILEFCRQHPEIAYLVTCAWPWNIELEIETGEEAKFKGIVREFRELMGEQIVDYDTLAIHAEHKMDYYPFEEGTKKK